MLISIDEQFRSDEQIFKHGRVKSVITLSKVQRVSTKSSRQSTKTKSTGNNNYDWINRMNFK